jgi:hypothetical protein
MSSERPYPWGQMHKNMPECIKTQHFTNKSAWKSSWHTWFQRRISMLDPKTTDWILQMFRAPDLVWINQWSIPEPNSQWQWNQGTSCHSRDKVQDRKLCTRIMAKGTPLVGVQSRNVTINEAHHCNILARIKMFQETGWGSLSSCLMTMWHPTQFRLCTFGMPSFCASEGL